MTIGNPPPRRQGGRKDVLRAGGFTLIEIITVIIILGILALIATSGSGTLGGAELARKAELRAQLRYVQLRAMKTGSFHGISCDGTDYWAFSGGNATDTAARLSLPGETSNTITLASKNLGMSTFTCYFDGLGIPYNGPPPTKLNTAQTITITAGGASDTLTITPETGYVP